MRSTPPSPARPRRRAVLAVLALFALAVSAGQPARAQLLNQLQNAVGSGSGAAGGGLGGLGGGVPSVTGASPGNLAGVLQYCIQNNDLSGSSAASVKDRLLGKLTGSGGGAANSGYSAGNSGMLETGPGQSYRLGGAGVQQQVTRKVCNLVLQHAQSML